MVQRTGQVAVVTGGNTGVGYALSRELAERGFEVVIASRDATRVGVAAQKVRDLVPGAQVRAVRLDLASLDSVSTASQEILALSDRIDVLVNNAGVMWAPAGRTEDGFEVHLGVNHLGHFALTWHLLPRVLAAPNGRVVAVSSPAHRGGVIHAADLDGGQTGHALRRYANSKLANLLFAGELNRRLSGTGAIAVAAHPGSARSELNRTMPFFVRGPRWGLAAPITHSVEAGAQCLLRAATDGSLRGGEYVGPGGWRELKGAPALLTPSDAALDQTTARELWAASERLTGIEYAQVLPKP
jgi:NAD(P)-dependent dehydrogenase (short-subunit alcohol dehydrogenase family)